ncbi:hypothetical protein Dimus_024641 [Dionaea muscipula]
MVAHAVVMPDEEEEQERSGTSCRQLDGGDNCWLPWFWAIGLRTDSGKMLGLDRGVPLLSSSNFVSVRCKIVSSDILLSLFIDWLDFLRILGIDLRSSKVCELGLLNFNANHVLYPSERKKFRCRYDYYWASVFKDLDGEMKPGSGSNMVEFARPLQPSRDELQINNPPSLCIIVLYE